MKEYKELTVKEMQQVSGGANACEWGVGLAGIAIGGIYSAAATAIAGPIGGYLAGAATSAAFIEIGSHCSRK